jgi:hypothetical protein
MQDKYSKLWVFYSGTFVKTGRYPTYEEMGEYMGVSRERIRQVVERGIELGYLYEPKKHLKRLCFNIEKFTK